MKFLIKSLILSAFIMGFYICTYPNNLSEIMHRLTFYCQNATESISDIVLQNKSINNNTKETNTKELMNEYFVTIFNPNHINDSFKQTLTSSNFNIINLNGSSFSEDTQNLISFLDTKNVLVINQKEPNELSKHLTLSEDMYRMFKYNDYSISYMKPPLLNNKDLLDIYKYLETFEDNNYLSLLIINNENLNKKVLSPLINRKRVFLITGDEFSIEEKKNFPIVTLGRLSDNTEFMCQLNLFISNYSLQKIKIKLFPTTLEGYPIKYEELEKILNSVNDNSKIKFAISENADYIYTEYDILKDS